MSVIPVRIVSGSMAPTLPAGRRILIRAGLPPRPGDVACFEHRGTLMVHRLHARIEAGPGIWFIHRGDASPRFGLVALDEIVGILPGAWRPPRPPRTLLLLRLAALLRHLVCPGAGVPTFPGCKPVL